MKTRSYNFRTLAEADAFRDGVHLGDPSAEATIEKGPGVWTVDVEFPDDDEDNCDECGGTRDPGSHEKYCSLYVGDGGEIQP